MFFIKSAGAGAKCDHFKLEVRTRVRAHLSLDVRATQKMVVTHTLQIICDEVTDLAS